MLRSCKYGKQQLAKLVERSKKKGQILVKQASIKTGQMEIICLFVVRVPSLLAQRVNRCILDESCSDSLEVVDSPSHDPSIGRVDRVERNGEFVLDSKRGLQPKLVRGFFSGTEEALESLTHLPLRTRAQRASTQAGLVNLAV